MLANRNEAISPYPNSSHNHLSHSSSFSLSTPQKPTPKRILPHNNQLNLVLKQSKATMMRSSSVLACNYAVSGAAPAELNGKPAAATSVSMASSGAKLPAVRAQQATGAKESSGVLDGRRAAMLCLAATLFSSAAAVSSANAGVIEEYLEKSKINKELNDKKRLATSGANFARAFTVQNGSCKFPENFTGCQDLAKQKKVPFLSEDLALECEGKDKYKCGSNVFWKW